MLFQVADEGGALTLGGISQCPSYLSGMSKADVQKEFKKQIDVFVSEGMDFLLCEVSLSILGLNARILYRYSIFNVFSTTSTLKRWSGQLRNA